MINIVKYKPFIEVETFNDFKTLKLSVDNSNSIYITYENSVQTFGTPDVLYGQFVFIKDSGIIYLKGHFFIDKDSISGLPSVTNSDNGKILTVVNGEWQLVSTSMLYSGTALPNDAYGRNGDIYIQTEEQEEQ